MRGGDRASLRAPPSYRSAYDRCEQHRRPLNVNCVPGATGEFLERVHPGDALPHNAQIGAFDAHGFGSSDGSSTIVVSSRPSTSTFVETNRRTAAAPGPFAPFLANASRLQNRSKDLGVRAAAAQVPTHPEYHSSWVGCGVRISKAIAARIWPGAQNAHWSASC